MSDRHTILVVEDNDDFYGALEAKLANQYDLLRATSAAGAHEILRSQAERIDVMVLDMWIPREDGGAPERNLGLEVLLTAKGRSSHPGMAPEIQVLVVTGHQDLQNAIESQRLGSFRYLVKGSRGMLDVLERDIEAACAETMGRRIHKAIMEGGRLDLLQALPLRGAENTEPVAAVAEIARAAGGTQDLAATLRQIRQLADEALKALEGGRV